MSSDSLDLFFFDVQHGNATYIRTPNNKHIMIDIGTGSIKNNKQIFSPLNYIRTKWGVEQLDLVVITHPHRDHIGDIDNLDKLNPKTLLRVKHLTDAEIIASNKPQDNPIIQKYLETCRRYNTPASPGDGASRPEDNGGVKIKHFFPKKCPKSNLNNHSIITIMEYEGNKIIIPGDNEDQSWKELLENPDFVATIKNADVLLASHHGREAGYSGDIFKYMNPYAVIISDGPSGDTSVTEKYSEKSRGWNVTSRSSGDVVKRKCLTTRQDKGIDVSFSKTANQRTIAISIV